MEIRKTPHLNSEAILVRWIDAIRLCREEIDGDAVTRRVAKLQPGLVKRLAMLERLVGRFAGIRDSESESSTPESGHEKADEEYEWGRLVDGAG